MFRPDGTDPQNLRYWLMDQNINSQKPKLDSKLKTIISFNIFLMHAGFCFGGPVGAFVGSFVGGAAAGIGTEAIIEAFTPEQEAERNHCRIEKCPMGINKQYLHRFRRRPAVRESIDHMFFRIKGMDMNLRVTKALPDRLYLRHAFVVIKINIFNQTPDRF